MDRAVWGDKDGVCVVKVGTWLYGGGAVACFSPLGALHTPFLPHPRLFPDENGVIVVGRGRGRWLRREHRSGNKARACFWPITQRQPITRVARDRERLVPVRARAKKKKHNNNKKNAAIVTYFARTIKNRRSCIFLGWLCTVRFSAFSGRSACQGLKLVSILSVYFFLIFITDPKFREISTKIKKKKECESRARKRGRLDRSKAEKSHREVVQVGNGQTRGKIVTTRMTCFWRISNWQREWERFEIIEKFCAPNPCGEFDV